MQMEINQLHTRSAGCESGMAVNEWVHLLGMHSGVGDETTS